MLSGRRPQAGLSQTSALGSVLVGAGKPQKREGGFLSGPWSHSGFAKSISPLIPGRSLALWSGSRPVTRQAPPGPLTWSGGGESGRRSRWWGGWVLPLSGPRAEPRAPGGGGTSRQAALLCRLSRVGSGGLECRAWGNDQGPFPRSGGSLARSQLGQCNPDKANELPSHYTVPLPWESPVPAQEWVG